MIIKRSCMKLSKLHANIRCCFSDSSCDVSIYFSKLGLPKESDQETVRKQFLELAKRFHPDSGSLEASATKFQEIDEAYRIIQNKFSRDRWNINENLGEYGLYYKEKEINNQNDVKQFDINHTAPQHRQYLSYGGIGYGTPFQREKQFSAIRASRAVTNVNDYRLNKLQNKFAGAVVKKDTKKKISDFKTRQGIERLVEDLIQESMSKGEFDNLPGSGKPLNSRNQNPYVDFVTHKMNEVLLDNGFTPTWITLQKEIREKIEGIINKLSKERAKLGPTPLNSKENEIWNLIKTYLTEDVKELNKKIDNYNLVVPILHKQMLHFNFEETCAKILNEVKPYSTKKIDANQDEAKLEKVTRPSFLELLSSLLFK